MKHLFAKWKGKTELFKLADLTEVTEDFSNPARGWYQIHTFSVDQEPDLEEQRWCLDARNTLALVLIDIGAFRKRDLEETALNRIQKILCFFQGNGYDCILRVVYDHEGKAFIREPADFAQVQAHMRQIGSVLQQCASSVFIFQGMLLGSWGEMHGSRFLNEKNMARLAQILREEKAPQTFLAVRRPVYWRSLHKEKRQGALRCIDGMGLFDDGIFGSASHLGTFAEEEKKKYVWEEPWSREQELAFENELCRQAPNGGEVVYNPGFVKTLTPGKTIEELRKMQITYLNRAHDERLLDIWKEWKYPGPGVWKGKSVFDYIGLHLGYRFVIRNAEVVRIGKEMEKYRIEVEIENIGFAGFYQEAEICLEYIDKNGRQGSMTLESQMRGWKSGEARKLSCVAEACKGELFLTAKRTRDGATIRFANHADAEGKSMLGVLL